MRIHICKGEDSEGNLLTVNTLSPSQLMYRCDKERTAAFPQLSDCMNVCRGQSQRNRAGLVLHSGGREAQRWIVTVSEVSI